MTTPAGTSVGSGTSSPPARPRPRVLALFLLLGALLGGLAGSALGLLQAQQYRANAVISVAPPSQVFDDVRATEDDSTAMVQSELIVLSGPTLRQEIQRLAGPGAPVSFSAAQVGTSTIVNIDAEAATSTRALEGAEAVVAAYSANRSERLRREVERAAGVVDSELSRLEQDLEAETIGAAALQQEYGRLLAVRSGLFRAAANADQAVTVVQPPVLAGDGLSPVSRYGALGALLGALAGAGLLMLVSRRRGVRSWDDLAEAGVSVLQPEIPAFSGPVRDFTGPQQPAAGMRLLVSQLVPTGDGGVLVLFGATPQVGTSFAAAAAAVCLSERADVLLVLAADLVEDGDGSAAVELGVLRAPVGVSTLPDAPLTPDDVLAAASSTEVRGVSVLARGPGPGDGLALRRAFRNGLLEACVATGRIVVVDAPALCDSTTTVDLAERAGGAALVVGRGVTTRSDVETVRQTFDRQGIPLLGVVVNRPSRLSEPVTRAEDGSRAKGHERPAGSPAGGGDGSRSEPPASGRGSTGGAAKGAHAQSDPSDQRGGTATPAGRAATEPAVAAAVPAAAAPDVVVGAPDAAVAPQGSGGSGEGRAASPLEQDWPFMDGALLEAPVVASVAPEFPVGSSAEPAAETAAESGAEPAGAEPATADDPVGWPAVAGETAGSELIGWPSGESVPDANPPPSAWSSRPAP